jgi:hypothetical protein
LKLPGGQKIYNTVNKLFALSKYRPVGVMVYGSGDFMRIPWETIIKMYRAELYDEGYPHLEEYASDFLEFFQRETSLFPLELQSASASEYVRIGLSRLKQKIDGEVRRTLTEMGSIDEDQVKALIRNRVTAFVEELEKCENLPGFTQGDIESCATECEKEIRQALQAVFEKLPIEEVSEQLLHVGSLILCKKFARTNYSGVVIAGYGEKDLFPSLVAYECECVINNRLRYVQTNLSKIGIDCA